MSGITDRAATQAHDIVEQAEAEEQRVSYQPLVVNEKHTKCHLSPTRSATDDTSSGPGEQRYYWRAGHSCSQG